MLGEWYLPPGACQVISTITEGTISFSRPPLIIHLSGDDPNTVSVSTSRLNPSSRISPQIRSSEPSGPPNPVPVGFVPVQTKNEGSTGLPARSRLIA